jgi:hypothetical protein
MEYDRSVVSVIEAAIDANPYCAVCGAPNVVRTEGTNVLLRCAGAETPRSAFGRLVYALLPHERAVVVN